MSDKRAWLLIGAVVLYGIFGLVSSLWYLATQT